MCQNDGSEDIFVLGFLLLFHDFDHELLDMDICDYVCCISIFTTFG